MVRRPHSTAPSGSFQLPVGDVWQGRRREWPRANLAIRCLVFPPSLDENLCALWLKSETHLRQSSLAHRIAQTSFILRVEHEETAPAGANQFPAQGAVRHRNIIRVVNKLVAHNRRPLLFAPPVNVHQPREFAEIIALQCALTLPPEFFYEI